MTKITSNKAIPYGADVRFFIDKRNKTAVPVWTDIKEPYNKGWVDIRVGAYTAKARRPDAYAAEHDLLTRNYPSNTVKTDFYNDLSYHSGINQGDAGKVTSYGTDSPYGWVQSLYPCGKVQTPIPGQDKRTRRLWQSAQECHRLRLGVH